MKKDAEHGHRIVSLAPSATAILCAIGANKTLVGVTKWCADVAPVGALPKLGDCWHMGSLDEILRLKPTLVIGSVPYKQETVGKLLEQPLNFLAMNPRTLADVYADIRLLGGIVGRAKAAEALAGKLQREFAEIESQPKKPESRSRVYCEAWPNPRISSPPWVAELVRLCGGEMVVPAGERVDETLVAEAMPDVIVHIVPSAEKPTIWSPPNSPSPPSTPHTSPRNSSSCPAVTSTPTPRVSKPPAGRHVTGSPGTLPDNDRIRPLRNTGIRRLLEG